MPVKCAHTQHDTTGCMTGTEMKQVRLALGMSQMALARTLAVTLDTVMQWERKAHLSRVQSLTMLGVQSEVLNTLSD